MGKITETCIRRTDICACMCANMHVMFCRCVCGGAQCPSRENKGPQRKANKTSEERKAAKVTSTCSLLKDCHKNAVTVFVRGEPFAPVLSGWCNSIKKEKKERKNKSGESHLNQMKYSCVDASCERWGVRVHQERFVLIPAARRSTVSRVWSMAHPTCQTPVEKFFFSF